MDYYPIDVIIPVYNAQNTLARAIESVLAQQDYLGTLWLVDDCSSDDSWAIAQQFAQRYPHKIQLEQMPKNCGVAKTRNWGALQSQADLIAFLDADDAYELQALEGASCVFHFRPEVNTLRLALTPVNIAERYAQHPNFDVAWQYMKMTCGGNLVFRRPFFLACGGFPQDQLFRELGGEDGALGIATTKISRVATIFKDAGVLHYCREGMHAERLLDAILFDKHIAAVSPGKIAQANAVTEKICQKITALYQSLSPENAGIQHLELQKE